MNKKMLLLIIAAIFLLVGIILALSGALVSSTIGDIDSSEVSAGIGLHVLVTVLFVLACNICLFLYIRTRNEGSVVSMLQLAFLGMFSLSGVFFALASGYHNRSALITEFYTQIKSAPEWYAEEFMSSVLFPALPGIADGFASTGTAWYIITCIAVVATVAIGVKAFGSVKPATVE